MAITDYKVSETYAGRDIASLPDRPNEAGMSASLLKARFDQLGKEVIPNYNDLIDFINLNLFSGGTQIGHTHNIDNLVDGLTYKLFTAVERAKLGAIAEGAEVNQNAFSNVKVGSTTIASTTKTDTFELVAGLNITMIVDSLTKQITLSASGVIATQAVQSLLEDIGNYFTSLNVEGALQEVGLSLLNKVDKVAGKGLSTEDYTSTEKTKLSGIATGANNYVHPTTHLPSIILQDANNRFVSDAEKSIWNAKQAPLVSGNNIKTINGNSLLGSGDIPTMLPKNWIINGMFDVWQRGTSQTSSGYGSDDRFCNIHGGSTKTNSRQAFVIGQTDVPNNPKYFSRTVVSSVPGASNSVVKQQWIEDVTKLAGKTIAFSFWAKADANKNISIEFREFFGTGGSTTIDAIGVEKNALTTEWQKFTKIVTLPSVAGKTIGDGSAVIVQWWFDAGSNFNARTDSLGQQSGTFDIANISLVEGAVPVECQNQPYADVLRECLRYFQRFGGNATYEVIGDGRASGVNDVFIRVPHKTSMRTNTPAIAISASSGFGLPYGNTLINGITSFVSFTQGTSKDATTLVISKSAAFVNAGFYQLETATINDYLDIIAEL